MSPKWVRGGEEKRGSKGRRGRKERKGEEEEEAMRRDCDERHKEGFAKEELVGKLLLR